MRIAMIGQKGIPARFGGVERHVYELSTRLQKSGHDVTVYGRSWYTDEADMLVDGVYSKVVPSIHTKHLDAISHTLIATIDALASGYDVIHYHGVGPALLSWIPRLLSPQTKVVTTFHSIDRKHEKWNRGARLFLRLGEWAACRFAHDVISVSRTIEQYARDVYDVDTHYIPNGVPTYKKTRSYKELKKWRIEPDEYVLIVSRLIPHKGIHYAIDAFTALQKKHPKLLGKKKLVIVGDGHYSDDYVHMLKDMAEENSKIVFTGFQTGAALEQLYSHASFVIHPSDQEGLPISVLEAMSYGQATILSDIPEHRELMNDKDYFFRHGNVRSLMLTLKRILSEPKMALTRTGKTAKQMVAERYNWQSIVRQVSSLYKTPITHPIETRILAMNK